MTSRKRAEGTRTAETAAVAPPDEPKRAPEVSDALRSPQRLTGWFGLLVRICVYFTAALCAELLLSAFERWTPDE